MTDLVDYILKIKSDYFNDSNEEFFKALNQSEYKISVEDLQLLEKGKNKPTKEFINSLLKFLDQSEKDKLIQLYCENLFPEHFIKMNEIQVRFSKQKSKIELSEYQVSELGKTKFHYYLFLILILKNEKVKKHILKKQFGNNDSIDIVIQDLLNCEILIENKNYIYTSSPNVSFPANTTDVIKKCYKLFDDWDHDFSKAFQYESLIEKTLIRRVNSKHIPIIKKQIEATLDLIRSSESSVGSTDQEAVVFFQLNLSKGT